MCSPFTSSSIPIGVRVAIPVWWPAGLSQLPWPCQCGQEDGHGAAHCWLEPGPRTSVSWAVLHVSGCYV